MIARQLFLLDFTFGIAHRSTWNHATAGGINQQFLKHLVERGLLTSVSEALDAVLHRINAQPQTPDAL